MFPHVASGEGHTSKCTAYHVGLKEILHLRLGNVIMKDIAKRMHFVSTGGMKVSHGYSIGMHKKCVKIASYTSHSDLCLVSGT